MAEPARRLPLWARLYIHLRMFRNAYRVTRQGLRHPVRAGDTINLKLQFNIKIGDTIGIFRA